MRLLIKMSGFHLFNYFSMPVTIFPVSSPVSQTFAPLVLVLRTHYAISRYMFTFGFQHNFVRITVGF